MIDWDVDSKQLRSNLRRVLEGVRLDAVQRVVPTVEAARRWHSDTMRQLAPPATHHVGRYRGEGGLEGCEVAVGTLRGVPAGSVAQELGAFEERLQKTVEFLDERIGPGEELDADKVAAVIEVCSWAHSEWVRIHPFANGNGRTARLWANSIAMRYGLPPFVRLRPRPDGGYGDACAAAMKGQWQHMVPVFRDMCLEAIRP